MKKITLDKVAIKITQMAKSATHSFDEKESQPIRGVLAMTAQTFRLSAACVLTLLAIVLTGVSTIFANLRNL